MRRASNLVYRRSFEIPGNWHAGRVLLHFQAVDWDATVLINGRQIGTHRGGYDAFSLDVTEALKPSGKQELIVHVFDPSSSGDQPRGKQVDKPRSIWYTPTTGIWQTVWLEPVPKARIARLRHVPDVDGGALRLTVEGVGTGGEYVVEAVARAGDVEVGRASGRVGAELRLALPAEQFKLWSPKNPFL